MSQDALVEFQKFIFTNTELQDQLRAIDDRLEFIEKTTHIGKEYGFLFTNEDVEEYLRASRRSWIERWI